MPVLQFTDNDYLAATPGEAGWYKARLTAIDGPKASSSGKGTNMFVTFTLTDGKLKGKEVTIAISSANKAGSASNLGGTIWYSQDVFIQVASAILNVKMGDVPKTLDTDTLKDKDLDVKLGVDTSEGTIKNTVIGFAAAGKGTAAAADSPF